MFSSSESWKIWAVLFELQTLIKAAARLFFFLSFFLFWLIKRLLSQRSTCQKAKENRLIILICMRLQAGLLFGNNNRWSWSMSTRAEQEGAETPPSSWISKNDRCGEWTVSFVSTVKTWHVLWVVGHWWFETSPRCLFKAFWLHLSSFLSSAAAWVSDIKGIVRSSLGDAPSNPHQPWGGWR